jgi:hypothetical protein
MGSVYFDANGDGVFDIWSSGTETNPVLLGPNFVVDAAAQLGLQTFPDPQGHTPEQWSKLLFDVDMDGHADAFLVQTASGADLYSQERPRDRFLWQAATGAWREASAQVGLSDDAHTCEAVHGADLDNDGDTDVIIGCYGALRILRNDVAPAGLGRTVVLHGKISNPDGVGAILIGPSGEKRLVRGGGQPFAGGVIHESIRAMGSQILVRWPSGIEQTVDAGAAAILDITEPDVFRIAARRVKAGSSAPVPIEVHPELIGPADAPVQVALSGGAWSQAPAKGDDGVWRGSITVPAASSVVVMTVTVGTKTLAVRPRLFVR